MKQLKSLINKIACMTLEDLKESAYYISAGYFVDDEDAYTDHDESVDGAWWDSWNKYIYLTFDQDEFPFENMDEKLLLNGITIDDESEIGEENAKKIILNIYNNSNDYFGEYVKPPTPLPKRCNCAYEICLDDRFILKYELANPKEFKEKFDKEIRKILE